jgi:hypothetical protein
MRDGIQLSEALTGDADRIFRHASGFGLEARRLALRQRPDAGMVEDEEPAV